MGNDAPGLHYEIERGFSLGRRQWRKLKRRAARVGLTFSRKLEITDLVIPSTGRSTRRLRIERTVGLDGTVSGVKLIRCAKSHPVAGKNGRHIRHEKEDEISLDAALAFVNRAVDRHEAAIPRYSKSRTEYTYAYAGFEMTISFDHAVGLGRYSGRYMEIETILPDKSPNVAEALTAIRNLALLLLGKKYKGKISYRKMLMATWNHSKASTSRKELARLRKEHRQLVRRAVA
jgi:hypothetical protein